MANFAKSFEWDDFDDAVDLVLCTDKDFDAAIERAIEGEDEDDLDGEMLINTLKENGDISEDIDCDDDDDVEIEYDEDEDDAVEFVDRDIQDYSEITVDVDIVEDMDEDDMIDTVIDSDPNDTSEIEFDLDHGEEDDDDYE
jgi:hypothetical protein